MSKKKGPRKEKKPRRKLGFLFSEESPLSEVEKEGLRREQRRGKRRIARGRS